MSKRKEKVLYHLADVMAILTALTTGAIVGHTFTFAQPQPVAQTIACLCMASVLTVISFLCMYYRHRLRVKWSRESS